MFPNQPNQSGSTEGQPSPPGQLPPPQPQQPMIPYNPNPAAIQPGQPAAQALQPLSQTLPAQPVPAQPAVYGPTSHGQPNDDSTTPYDFFLNTPKEPKKKLLSKPKTKFSKIVFIAIAAFMVLGIAAVAVSAVQASKNKAPELVVLAQSQQYIISTSDTAGKTLQSQNLINFAATAKSTTTSAQQQLIDYTIRRGIRVDVKSLTALTDNTSLQQLTAAQAAGTYDATYVSIMQAKLQSYAAKLEQMRSTSVSSSEQNILTKDLEAAKLLQTMLTNQ